MTRSLPHPLGETALEAVARNAAAARAAAVAQLIADLAAYGQELHERRRLYGPCECTACHRTISHGDSCWIERAMGLEFSRQ